MTDTKATADQVAAFVCNLVSPSALNDFKREEIRAAIRDLAQQKYSEGWDDGYYDANEENEGGW